MKINSLSEIVEVEKLKPVQQVIKSSISFSDALKRAQEENKKEEEKQPSRQLNWDSATVSTTVAAAGWAQSGYIVDRSKKDDREKD